MGIAVADVLRGVGYRVAVEHVTSLGFPYHRPSIGQGESDLESGDDVHHVRRMGVHVLFRALPQHEVEHAHVAVLENDVVVLGIDR